MLKTKNNLINIGYTLEGNQNNPVLVFSNSLGTNHTMWDGQCEILKENYFIVRYDTRGHGESDVPNTPSSIEELGNDVLNLMDELGIATFHFCGLSIGGLTGQWLGLNAQNRLEKLIIANTAMKIGAFENWNDRIETVRENGLSSIIEGTRKIWFSKSFAETKPQLVNTILDDFIKTPIEGYISCCVAVRDADFTNQIEKITTPTLIFTGTNDIITTVLDGIEMTKKIKNSEMVELNAAHISNIEDGHLFTTKLLKFLKK